MCSSVIAAVTRGLHLTDTSMLDLAQDRSASAWGICSLGHLGRRISVVSGRTGIPSWVTFCRFRYAPLRRFAPRPLCLIFTFALNGLLFHDLIYLWPFGLAMSHGLPFPVFTLALVTNAVIMLAASAADIRWLTFRYTGESSATCLRFLAHSPFRSAFSFLHDYDIVAFLQLPMLTLAVHCAHAVLMAAAVVVVVVVVAGRRRSQRVRAALFLVCGFMLERFAPLYWSWRAI